MTDGKKDQLKRKKTLEYELRRLYRAGELTDQQIAELKEAEFPFDAPVRRTAKSVVRIDDGKRWPSCSAAEKELGITQGWMSDVCNMALRGKWVAIKNQFYCFESMYSPDMDLTEIRGLAGWIVNLETGEMFPTTTEAAKAAGTSRSVVLDHVKNKVKPQNKRFSYVRDWDGKVGRLVDLNVQMICLETDTIYHSYDEICAAIWSDGYGETRKEIVQKVGDAIRHGCPAFDMHWANRENFEERKEAYMEENLHGALWPCAIMLPLAALLDSKLDPNARVALAVTILLTIACVFLLDSVSQRAGERINRRRRAPHRNQPVYRPVQTNRYPTRVRLDRSSSYASSYASWRTVCCASKHHPDPFQKSSRRLRFRLHARKYTWQKDQGRYWSSYRTH